MKNLSQAELESRAMTLSSPVLAEGWQEDWTLDLGERKAIFHPMLKQWFWFDRAHEQWVSAQCSAGEAILMTYEGMGGMKKLPQAGNVADWCVYYDQVSLTGPLPVKELHHLLATGAVPVEARVWTPCAREWLTVFKGAKGEFHLRGRTGEPLLILTGAGLQAV